MAKKKTSEKPASNIPDNIIQVNVLEQYKKDMAEYSLGVLFERFIPNVKDGLKPVQRRAIYCMWHDIHATSFNTKKKSANTTGMTIAFYHPHTDTSVYEAMKTMTNFWEIKEPLINYDSNSGSIQGGPQAAQRYTESYLSEFTMDVVLKDLIESPKSVNWDRTFDNYTEEPQFLPVRVPLLLVNGTFGIAIGRKIEVPKHSLNDVIDATINVLHDPNAKVVLIPDHCLPCEIVDTDWTSISNMGYGYYTVRGIIKTEDLGGGKYALHILSVPDLVTPNNITEKLDQLKADNTLPQISMVDDLSTANSLDICVYLKPGSDPEYVKNVIYNKTPIKAQERVNMEVIVHNGDELNIKRYSYKAYIVEFINTRRNVKFRLYNARLQKARTRLHTIEIFIAILKSGDIESIIHAIRNQKPEQETQLIQWLMKKLNITDVQAKYILGIEIGKLNKSSLSKYIAEQKQLTETINGYFAILSNPQVFDQEIEQELLEIKRKYGKPRQSILISEANATNIPEGTFKVVLYESNFIKKVDPNEVVKPYRGDNPRCIIVGDNSKDIILFDEIGRAFKLPIHRIPFSDKASNGIDIRLLIKNASNIISMMYLPIIDTLAQKVSSYFLVVLSKQGLIKRIDLTDLLSSTLSGIIFSKLNPGDSICDVIITNSRSDIIVYTHSKCLRMSIDSIPYLKRSTMGSMSIKSTESVDGMSVVTSETKDVIVVTARGKFNRITQAALPRSERGKAGTKVIKLLRGDFIQNVFTCRKSTIIRCYHSDGTATDVITDNIPMGSSVSQGEKLTKDIIKAEQFNMQ